MAQPNTNGYDVDLMVIGGHQRISVLKTLGYIEVDCVVIEIDKLFSEVPPKGIQEDDFDVDEALKEPTISQLGDVWLLGKHRLICGDSTDPAVFNLFMDITYGP